MSMFYLCCIFLYLYSFIYFPLFIQLYMCLFFVCIVSSLTTVMESYHLLGTNDKEEQVRQIFILCGAGVSTLSRTPVENFS